MKLWTSNKDLFELMRRSLFSAVVGDVMDKMDLQRQFLPPRIKPLHSDMIVAGRAMTVLEADIAGETGDDGNAPKSPAFGLMFRALDDLKPDEVYLCAGASPTYALWGELMSTRAMRLGAAGAVMDGYSRDTKGILALNFPTFSLGSYAQDQAPRGRVTDFRVPVEIDGVRVAPGDIVFGDLDGICIIPREAEDEVINRALEKVNTENLIRKGLLEGMSASDAFAKYGVM